MNAVRSALQQHGQLRTDEHVDAALQRAAELAARWIMKAAVVLAAVVTSSAISSDLLPSEYASAPQPIALGLWLIIAASSMFSRQVRPVSHGTDFWLILSFFGWAIASFAWSNWSIESAGKCAALIVTTFGAFRLAIRLPFHEIIGATSVGLLILLLLSLAAVVIAPEIGIDQSWMHGGQWRGIFESKQSLGLVAAYAAFFALYLRLTGGSWLAFLFSFGLSTIMLVASGSRGSAAVMVVASSLLALCRIRSSFVRIVSAVPLLCTCTAFALILYLYTTELNHFPVFGIKLDLTERTFIWQYGISHIDQRPVFGFGLNGFWSDERLFEGFRAAHGWVLDNFHSGYLTILIECGLIGFTLFLLIALLFAVRICGLAWTRSIPAPQCALIACFVVLSFQMNLTETLFLRSTSFMAILFVVFLFLACHPLCGEERASRAGLA